MDKNKPHHGARLTVSVVAMMSIGLLLMLIIDSIASDTIVVKWSSVRYSAVQCTCIIRVAMVNVRTRDCIVSAAPGFADSFFDTSVFANNMCGECRGDI